MVALAPRCLFFCVCVCVTATSVFHAWRLWTPEPFRVFKRTVKQLCRDALFKQNGGEKRKKKEKVAIHILWKVFEESD